MPLDRLRVANMENWGNLVKAWAKGEKPRPTTLDEFRDQCGLADVGMHVPAYVTAVQFAQAPGKETLLLRLPTTSTRSASGAISLTAFCRLVVA